MGEGYDFLANTNKKSKQSRQRQKQTEGQTDVGGSYLGCKDKGLRTMFPRGCHHPVGLSCCPLQLAFPAAIPTAPAPCTLQHAGIESTGVFTQTGERPTPSPVINAFSKIKVLRVEKSPEDTSEWEPLGHPQFQQAWEGELLTRWPRSCLLPSPHSSGRGLPGPRAALTRSSNNLLRS